MASRFPPAGVIPAGHPCLAVLWRTREAKSAPFLRLVDLISILSCVDGKVVEDPNFLERTLLVDGVTARTTPKDLLESFPLISPRAAVVVRESMTGYRVGLVVFSDAAHAARAMDMTPRRGFYAYCILASSRGHAGADIEKALQLQFDRLPTGMLLRSLVPPQYFLEDEEMDAHLRCVFLSGLAGVSGGAYGLCRVVRDELLARGYVRAVILHRAADAAALVFDDAETTELLDRGSPRLLLRHGVWMHDSSLFPYAAAPTSPEAPLLPHFVVDPGFKGRILTLTGLDTELCDAAEIAYSIQHHLDLMFEQDHLLEAVMVHRSQKVVIVVLGSSEDAETVLQEPPEVWEESFGRQVSWARPISCPDLSHSDCRGVSEVENAADIVESVVAMVLQSSDSD